MSTARIVRTAALAGAASALATLWTAGASAYERLDQGEDWDEAARSAYYTLDQGSRLIPYAWAKALKQPNGQGFLADGLARYGYLPNPGTKEGLPVGFMVADSHLSLNCAACHTRQIEYGGVSYRIDGGPALADIGQLWADLDVAVDTVLNDSTAFAEFATTVLASGSGGDEASLRKEVKAWHDRHHIITEKGLPKPPDRKPWGVGRLDAVGMILNRVTGLDIGETPNRIIPENIRMADAPVRPPFLWNAWRQDQTQWPGFADNGDRILALSRNVGQVYGVFGKFFPTRESPHLLKIDYVSDNSTNFAGLRRLERLIEKIDPPRWPQSWPYDEALAAKGREVYARHTDLNNPGTSGCADCHEVRPGKPRFLNKEDTWCTPVQDVGTDALEYKHIADKWPNPWIVKTAVMNGADIPFLDDLPALKPEDSPLRVLGTAVRGAILQHHLPILLDANERTKAGIAIALVTPLVNQIKNELRGMYRIPAASGSDPRDDVCNAPKTKGPFRYEARVLKGIWAAAPYLHNGSVPTLADLLKPAKDRPTRFKIGPAYDAATVGLAVDQSNDNALDTDDCTGKPPPAHTGNGHCGHNYGTSLLDADKKALLEYLKKL